MNSIASLFTEFSEVRQNADDYLGEDGLLYCGKCRTPKQFRMEGMSFFGNHVLPINCRCRQERIDRDNAVSERLRHEKQVETLKRSGFTDASMREWTFANDNGGCPQMQHAKFYVEHFAEMEERNIGYLLWGAVGTGKSFFAGCIANALMEQEIPVRMTNFASILNDLNAAYDAKNEVIDRLNRCRLLILDDFGMERGTEYGLEQVYNVIDSRYRRKKPLIVTTNLTQVQMKNPTDTAHARIYDRVLEMCVPICFNGESQRRSSAADKLRQYYEMIR